MTGRTLHPLTYPTRALILGLAAVAAVGCSSGSDRATGRGPTRAGTTATSPIRATASTGAGGGAFCGDVRRLTISAARISRSLTTFTPAQVRQAVDADMRLESTAAAEAPAAIRPDVLVASNAHQFQALARAGYDITKVDGADMETTALQKTALARVRAYLVAHCGFDPRTLASAGA